MNVLVVEYPGYSIYEGTPSEETLFEDARGILEFATNDMSFEPSNIILFGRSLGSGMAVYMASLKQYAGLILFSPFESLSSVVDGKFGILGKMLIKERFNNLERANLIKSPTLLIHGAKDDIVPISHSYNIYSMFGSRRKHPSIDRKDGGDPRNDAQYHRLLQTANQPYQ
jgi:predicted esterase